VILIWDGHAPVFSSGGGMAPLIADLKGYRETFWRALVFRHSRSSTDMYGGPNAVYADGHAEQVLDVSALTDDNANVPAP
jgi:prepilin-type processing-associated H-X9-DG protein